MVNQIGQRFLNTHYYDNQIINLINTNKPKISLIKNILNKSKYFIDLEYIINNIRSEEHTSELQSH